MKMRANYEVWELVIGIEGFKDIGYVPRYSLREAMVLEADPFPVSESRRGVGLGNLLT